MPTRPDARRLAALALGVALAAAACGSGESDASTPTLATDVVSGADDTTGDTAPAAAPESTDSTEPAEPGDGETETTEAVDHLFPDLDVVEVSSGSTVNLAQELAGGDKAVLLWFWAPH